MPGVTIGENTVIGAGSVVTKDIPANVVAVGNPCRVMRPIGEKDRMYFYKDQKIDWEAWNAWCEEQAGNSLSAPALCTQSSGNPD